MMRFRSMVSAFVAATVAAGTTVWFSSALAQSGTDVEPSPVFKASEVLPPELVSGPGFRVQDYVYSDGLVNIYNLDTEHGQERVEMTALLKERIHEIATVRQMEEVKRSKTFGEAMKNAAKTPFRLAKGLVTEPKDTVSGVASGIGSHFRNIGHALFGSPSEQEEGTLKTAIGFATAKRGFAFKFGVDPYSTYEPLQKRLNEISWAAFAGGMTVSGAFRAIKGTAGTVASGSKFAGTMNEMVRDNAPAELKKLNAEKLKAMRIGDSLAKTFLEHPKYSPTHATFLIGALERMQDIGNREIFLERAVLVEDEKVAFYFQRWAQMMAAYHENVAPVGRMVELGSYPFLQTQEGVVIGILPVDYLAWTELLAAKADGSATRALKHLVVVTGQELWFDGTASPTARRKLEERGWTVKDGMSEKLTLN